MVHHKQQAHIVYLDQAQVRQQRCVAPLHLRTPTLQFITAAWASSATSGGAPRPDNIARQHDSLCQKRSSSRAFEKAFHNYHRVKCSRRHYSTMCLVGGLHETASVPRLSPPWLFNSAGCIAQSRAHGTNRQGRAWQLLTRNLRRPVLARRKAPSDLRKRRACCRDTLAANCSGLRSTSTCATGLPHEVKGMRKAYFPMRAP